MTSMRELSTPIKNSWCPGCGNFGILMAVKRAVVQLGLDRENVVAVTGIGCHGKITNYIKVNGIHVIHGRVLPVATGIKLANHDLTVVGFAGDGDAYNIGMGHLPHTARKNPDITFIVHNNMVYGLTTGQASPTSKEGFKTKTTPRGVFEIGVNPITLALSSNASFVARGYAGDMHHLTEIIKEGLTFPGFSFIDVLQPCVAWNRINTYDFYKERVYKLEETGHDTKDFLNAFERGMEWNDKIPIGIFYKEKRATYRKNFPFLGENPLVKHGIEDIKLAELIKEFY